MNPKMTAAGDVYFAALVQGGAAPGAIFVYSSGSIRKVVADGDPARFDPTLTVRLGHFSGSTPPPDLTKFDVDPLGTVVFTSSLNDTFAILRMADGRISRVAITGDPVAGFPGEALTGPIEDLSSLSPGYVPVYFSLNGVGDVVFPYRVCCGNHVTGLFKASLASPAISNAGFEISDASGLPQAFETTWNNSGKGEAFLTNSGGADSFEGNSCLRMHVPQGGGATFVLSDPIPVSADTPYFLASRMRYNLQSDADSACFTVVQYDSQGHELEVKETVGIKGDNFWTWQPRRLTFHTTPSTSSIRIRFGLVAVSESYLDIDALGK
jgi:hypothetical protein